MKDTEHAHARSWPSTTDTLGPALDLTNCDREPVQFPGAIMPHGVLLLLDPASWRIRGVSANTGEWLGCEPTELFGAGLDRLWPAETCAEIQACLDRIGDPAPPQYVGGYLTRHRAERFDCFAHRSGAFLILELEPIPTALAERWPTARFAAVSASMGRLQRASGWREGMEIAVRELKRLSGFESVQGVRFMPDGSGLVVAEAHDDCYPSYLDLRFPRSDIPGPARQQLALMPVQYAPDLAYRAVPLLLAETGTDVGQIDLGHSVLRSTSMMCNRFYLNLNVQARLVLTILNRGELWGFFVCWNRVPRPVPYADRLAYRIFAEMAGLLLVEKEVAEHHTETLEAKRRLEHVVAGLNGAETLAAAMAELPAALLENLDLEGAALTVGSRIFTAGRAPPESFIRNLVSWLDGQEALLATDRLTTQFPPAAEHGAAATGLLAARLLEPGHYLLGFRPEWVHEVRWAGNPLKPVEIDLTSGEERLTPRGSFEVWKQDVRGLARPWLAHEIEGFLTLQRALVLTQHTDRQRELGVRLERSNAELEAFAYIVSHDLKEPLRGIRNFAHFLVESMAERLEGTERRWLDTIMTLTVRMSDQIDALLQYSRAGQQSLDIQSVDIPALLKRVLDSLSARIHETGAEVVIAPGMPTLACDPVRTKAIFENLIGNGLKYNDKQHKRVDVGFMPGEEATFFVRDNGIGIEDRHHEAIFTIFRRLHGRDEFGGGTGAGLTITRKHVEQQGGRLWLESTPGQGTCFFFTIGSARVGASGAR